jgi:hypothetical protein
MRGIPDPFQLRMLAEIFLANISDDGDVQRLSKIFLAPTYKSHRNPLRLFYASNSMFGG